MKPRKAKNHTEAVGKREAGNIVSRPWGNNGTKIRGGGENAPFMAGWTRERPARNTPSKE